MHRAVDLIWFGFLVASKVGAVVVSECGMGAGREGCIGFCGGCVVLFFLVVVVDFVAGPIFLFLTKSGMGSGGTCGMVWSFFFLIGLESFFSCFDLNFSAFLKF